jgi:hypothetical protein
MQGSGQTGCAAQGQRFLTLDREHQSRNPVRVLMYIRCEFRIAAWLAESKIIFGRGAVLGQMRTKER